MPILKPVATDNVSSRKQVHTDIKGSLPKYALKKYQKMMDVIESSPNMAYVPMSRALTIEGAPVENTNIVDLVVESLCRKNASPKKLVGKIASHPKKQVAPLVCWVTSIISNI